MKWLRRSPDCSDASSTDSRRAPDPRRPSARLAAPCSAGWPSRPAALWAAVRLLGLDRGPLVQALAFTPYVAGCQRAAADPRPRPAALVAGGGRGPGGGGRCSARWRPGRWPPRSRRSTGPDRAAAHRQPARRRRPTRRTLVELVRRHQVDVLTVQEFTPDAQAALDRLGLGHAAAAPAAQPGDRHARLRALLPVAAHRRRRPAQPRRFGLHPGVRDGGRPRRAPGPRRVGPPVGTVRAGPGGRLARRPGGATTGHPGRRPADPRRRLQRHPRPQPAAGPAGHRLRRRRRRRRSRA